MYWRTGDGPEPMHRWLLARRRWVVAVLAALYVFIVVDIFVRNDGTLGHALLVGLAIEAIFVVVAAVFLALAAVLRPKP